MRRLQLLPYASRIELDCSLWNRSNNWQQVQNPVWQSKHNWLSRCHSHRHDDPLPGYYLRLVFSNQLLGSLPQHSHLSSLSRTCSINHIRYQQWNNHLASRCLFWHHQHRQSSSKWCFVLRGSHLLDFKHSKHSFADWVIDWRINRAHNYDHERCEQNRCVHSNSHGVTDKLLVNLGKSKLHTDSRSMLTY